MQLLVLLFLLLGGANRGNFGEVKELAEELGGEEIKTAIEDAEKICKEAEQISSLISAFGAFGGADGANGGASGINADAERAHTRNGRDCGGSDDRKEKRYDGRASDDFTVDDGCEFAPHGFPLEPVSRIADEGILFCLSRYIALGE